METKGERAVRRGAASRGGGSPRRSRSELCSVSPTAGGASLRVGSIASAGWVTSGSLPSRTSALLRSALATRRRIAWSHPSHREAARRVVKAPPAPAPGADPEPSSQVAKAEQKPGLTLLRPTPWAGALIIGAGGTFWSAKSRNDDVHDLEPGSTY